MSSDIAQIWGRICRLWTGYSVERSFHSVYGGLVNASIYVPFHELIGSLAHVLTSFALSDEVAPLIPFSRRLIVVRAKVQLIL